MCQLHIVRCGSMITWAHYRVKNEQFNMLPAVAVVDCVLQRVDVTPTHSIWLHISCCVRWSCYSDACVMLHCIERLKAFLWNRNHRISLIFIFCSLSKIRRTLHVLRKLSQLKTSIYAIRSHDIVNPVNFPFFSSQCDYDFISSVERVSVQWSVALLSRRSR